MFGRLSLQLIQSGSWYNYLCDSLELARVDHFSGFAVNDHAGVENNFVHQISRNCFVRANINFDWRVQTFKILHSFHYEVWRKFSQCFRCIEAGGMETHFIPACRAASMSRMESPTYRISLGSSSRSLAASNSPSGRASCETYRFE